MEIRRESHRPSNRRLKNFSANLNKENAIAPLHKRQYGASDIPEMVAFEGGDKRDLLMKQISGLGVEDPLGDRSDHSSTPEDYDGGILAPRGIETPPSPSQPDALSSDGSNMPGSYPTNDALARSENAIHQDDDPFYMEEEVVDMEEDEEEVELSPSDSERKQDKQRSRRSYRDRFNAMNEDSNLLDSSNQTSVKTRSIREGLTRSMSMELPRKNSPPLMPQRSKSIEFPKTNKKVERASLAALSLNPGDFSDNLMAEATMALAKNDKCTSKDQQLIQNAMDKILTKAPKEPLQFKLPTRKRSKERLSISTADWVKNAGSSSQEGELPSSRSLTRRGVRRSVSVDGSDIIAMRRAALNKLKQNNASADSKDAQNQEQSSAENGVKSQQSTIVDDLNETESNMLAVIKHTNVGRVKNMAPNSSEGVKTPFPFKKRQVRRSLSMDGTDIGRLRSSVLKLKRPTVRANSDQINIAASHERDTTLNCNVADSGVSGNKENLELPIASKSFVDDRSGVKEADRTSQSDKNEDSIVVSTVMDESRTVEQEGGIGQVEVNSKQDQIMVGESSETNLDIETTNVSEGIKIGKSTLTRKSAELPDQSIVTSDINATTSTTGGKNPFNGSDNDLSLYAQNHFRVENVKNNECISSNVNRRKVKRLDRVSHSIEDCPPENVNRFNKNLSLSDHDHPPRKVIRFDGTTQPANFPENPFKNSLRQPMRVRRSISMNSKDIKAALSDDPKVSRSRSSDGLEDMRQAGNRAKEINASNSISGNQDFLTKCSTGHVVFVPPFSPKNSNQMEDSSYVKGRDNVTDLDSLIDAKCGDTNLDKSPGIETERKFKTNLSIPKAKIKTELDFQSTMAGIRKLNKDSTVLEDCKVKNKKKLGLKSLIKGQTNFMSAMKSIRGFGGMKRLRSTKAEC